MLVLSGDLETLRLVVLRLCQQTGDQLLAAKSHRFDFQTSCKSPSCAARDNTLIRICVICIYITVRMRDDFQTGHDLIGNKAVELAQITRALLFIARTRARVFCIAKFNVAINIASRVIMYTGGILNLIT